MAANLTEKLKDLLKDADEGFTFEEIWNTAAVREYDLSDVRHVLDKIAYKRERRWRLKTIVLPVTRNVVPKAEKPVKPVRSKPVKLVAASTPTSKEVSSDSILEFLKNHPEGVTHLVLAGQLNVQKAVLATKLKELVDSKQIERSRFRIGHRQGRNQSERFFLPEHKDYVELHLQLSYIKEQAAKAGYNLTIKLKGFSDVQF
jgi:hypothetical protein